MPAEPEVAGLWIRVFASAIDGLLLIVTSLTLSFGSGYLVEQIFPLERFGKPFVITPDPYTLVINGVPIVTSNPPYTSYEPPGWLVSLSSFTPVIVTVSTIVAYSALLEASPWQATVGKRIVGLRVTQSSGERLTVLNTLIRTMAKMASALPFFAGLLFIGLTDGKRAFHDFLAGTKVIKDDKRYFLKRSVMSETTNVVITNSTGAVVTIAKHMENVRAEVRQNLRRADQPDDVKALVEQLTEQVNAVSKSAPATLVAQMTKNLTRLTEELASQQPEREWYRVSLNGLKQAAEAVGELAVPIITTVKALLPILIP